MTELHMSPKGYNVTRSFEGRSLRAYKDIVGVWTIGFGNTNSDSSVLGFEIKAGVRITEEQAESLLKVAMEQRYEPAVRAAFPDATPQLFDAGCDFVYNIGTGSFSSRNWVVQLKAGKDPIGILAYNHAGGKVVSGLDRRRRREYAMIKTGDYGPEGSAAPAELTLDASGNEVGGKIATTTPVKKIPASSGMLRLGDEGPEVKDLQAALVTNKFPCPVTGTYDPETVQAVARFQQAHPQLDVDGIAGPATRAALQRGVDMVSKAGRSTVAGTATGGAIAADQAGHATPFLPTWSITLLAVAFAAAVGYLAYQYRDEIKAYFTKG